MSGAGSAGPPDLGLPAVSADSLPWVTTAQAAAADELAMGEFGIGLPPALWRRLGVEVPPVFSRGCLLAVRS